MDWSIFGAIWGEFPRFGVRFFPIVAKLERIARGALNCRALMVSSISSPSACAARRKTSRCSNVARLLSTLPRSRFSPTKMQPSVSSAVLPLWISTPAYPFTLTRRGRTRPKRGERVCMSMRYVPVGIAVAPFTLRTAISSSDISPDKPRSVSSSVSQKYFPLISIRPMV